MLLTFSLLLLGAAVAAAAGDDWECEQIPGKLKQIDAGAGGVWGVNNNDDIFQWKNNSWTPISGKLTHVSTGPVGVWGVNRANNVYKRQGDSWISIPGLLKQVDAGGNKFVSGVNSADNIFYLRNSFARSGVIDAILTQIEGSLKYYSCGLSGCWGVNNGKNIFYHQNITPSTSQGTSLLNIDGKLNMVEVGTDGSVYGVNSAGNVYRREGITEKTPTGTSWTKLDLSGTFKHVTYDNGYLWLLNTSEDIYRCF